PVDSAAGWRKRSVVPCRTCVEQSTPGNTAPAMRAGAASILGCLSTRSAERSRAGDDFHQLRCDLRLACTVVIALQRLAELARVVRGGLHRDHPHHLLADDALVERLEE